MKKNCQEGRDYNSPKTQRSREHLDREWETSVKMALISRDLMVGNPRLAEYGVQAVMRWKYSPAAAQTVEEVQFRFTSNQR